MTELCHASRETRATSHAARGTTHEAIARLLSVVRRITRECDASIDAARPLVVWRGQLGGRRAVLRLRGES